MSILINILIFVIGMILGGGLMLGVWIYHETLKRLSLPKFYSTFDYMKLSDTEHNVYCKDPFMLSGSGSNIQEAKYNLISQLNQKLAYLQSPYRYDPNSIVFEFELKDKL